MITGQIPKKLVMNAIFEKKNVPVKMNELHCIDIVYN